MKKILLSSMIMVLAFMTSNAQNRFDVNRDGAVNGSDVTALYKHLLGEDEPDPTPAERGLYICNQAGWDAVALYAWPENEVLPGWPGITPSGTVEKYDKTYYKFDMNDNYFGTPLNFIANNNDNGQQVDLMSEYTLGDEPVYVVVYQSKTGAIAYRIDDGQPFVEPDPEEGYTVYVNSALGWDAYAMYVWSNTAGGNVEAGWPGVRPAETKTINGKQWIVFKMTKAYSSYNDTNWIINNNGGGSQFDLMSNYDFQADVYVTVAADGTFTISSSAN